MRQKILFLLMAVLSICACAGRQPTSLSRPQETRLSAPLPPREAGAPVTRITPVVAVLKPVDVVPAAPVLSPREASQEAINRDVVRTLAVQDAWLREEVAKIHASQDPVMTPDVLAMRDQLALASSVRNAAKSAAHDRAKAHVGRADKDHHRVAALERNRHHGKNRHKLKKKKLTAKRKTDAELALFSETRPPHAATAAVTTPAAPAVKPPFAVMPASPVPARSSPTPAPVPTQTPTSVATATPASPPSVRKAEPVSVPPRGGQDQGSATSSDTARGYHPGLGLGIFFSLVVVLIVILRITWMRFRRTAAVPSQEAAAAASGATVLPTSPAAANPSGMTPATPFQAKLPAAWFPQSSPGAAMAAPERDQQATAGLSIQNVRRPPLPGLPPVSATPPSNPGVASPGYLVSPVVQPLNEPVTGSAPPDNATPIAKIALRKVAVVVDPGNGSASVVPIETIPDADVRMEPPDPLTDPLLPVDHVPVERSLAAEDPPPKDAQSADPPAVESPDPRLPPAEKVIVEDDESAVSPHAN